MGYARDARANDYLHQQLLAPDEEVTWSGRPDPARCALREVPKLLFGMFFFGFAVFWTVMAASAGLFALFGIPFLVIGALIVSSPIRAYFRAMRTYYAITNKRVVILTLGGRTESLSIAPQQIQGVERIDHRNGRASLRLRQTVGSDGRGGKMRTIQFADGLWGIDDAKGAADAIAALHDAH